LSRLRHCRKSAQPVPKAAYRSSCRDKHGVIRTWVLSLHRRANHSATRLLRPALCANTTSFTNRKYITRHNAAREGPSCEHRSVHKRRVTCRFTDRQACGQTCMQIQTDAGPSQCSTPPLMGAQYNKQGSHGSCKVVQNEK